ncbi:motility associated factor glycosyltransferase family protein [Paenibacillus aquistagni]|uniref:motility associated factor glycosyltransferase family protein n=1 Tax=Paenibacillus aquistagni TaxID=1852522 RepID=UPI001483A3E3|nr:6-hydroxymethylpterin diphosphokinase MptE-like protein [Paenibacillus aquistagni]
MERLKQRFPQLAEEIAGRVIDKDHSIDYTRNSELNLKITRNTRTHYIYSSYNIEREVSLWIDNASNQIEHSQYVLLIGWGLGYHIHALLKRYPSKKYFIYEPDFSSFLISLKHADLAGIIDHPNLMSIAIGNHRECYHSFLDQFTENVSDSFSEMYIPSYKILYQDEIEQFSSLAIELTKMKRSNLATFSQFSLDWIRNIMKNIKYISKFPGVSFLANVLENRPVVIVGSGPSLKYNLEILRELKNNVTIIAAGTSTQALLKANIIPDLIVSIDGGIPNLRAFKSLEIDNIPMVFGSFLQPDILSDSRKRLAYAIMDLDVVTPHLIPDEESSVQFKSNYSVTGLCIQLAVYMGSTTIVLTGQDLSFPGRQYYSEGINHVEAHATTIIANSADQKVINVDGGFNETNHGMYVTLKDIEHLISLFKGVRFINASQHGALINGSSFFRLEQMKEELMINEGVDFQGIFDEAIDSRQNISDYVLNQLKNDIKHLSVLTEELRIILKLLDRAGKIKNNRSDLVSALVQVSKRWNKVSLNEAYKVYVNFGLRSILNSYQRYISEVTFTNDPEQQYVILNKYLGQLCRLILEFIPEVETVLKDSHYTDPKNVH